jgi:hypothetical protein
MIVNTIARKMGLNPSSNGQLIKTALEAGGLAARRFATQLPSYMGLNEDA